MRYTIIAFILASTFLFTGTSRAANTIGGPAIPHTTTIPHFKGMEHFLEKFPDATDVNCKAKGQFTEVNFIWNGLKLQAFYNAAGEPVATSRYITTGNLPVAVQMSLKNDYPAYVVDEAVEFNEAQDGLCYYVTVRGAKNSYLLRVSTSGIISVFKKMKQ